MTTHDYSQPNDRRRPADQPPSADGPPTGDQSRSGDARRRYGQPRTEVPSDEEPAARCRLCDRPFPTTERHALHMGEVHGEDLTAAERDRYEDARESESDDLFLYHLKVIATLGTLYAVLVLVYMVVLAL